MWGDRVLNVLILHTDFSDKELGPPHTATREEWKSLLLHFSKHMPTMTRTGKLMIYHQEQSISWYDELLLCLVPSLPLLVKESGIRSIELWCGIVSGRAVLAFMAALQHEGWSVKAGKNPVDPSCCLVGVVGGEVGVCLHGTKVVGSRKTLNEISRRQHVLFEEPLWEEEDYGSVLIYTSNKCHCAQLVIVRASTGQLSLDRQTVFLPNCLVIESLHSNQRQGQKC